MATADSYGQLSSLILAEEAARQQGMQNALANLSGSLRNFGARRQQQQQFDTSAAAAQRARDLDEAYRQAALETNAQQFGQTRADRQAQVALDEAYRQAALRQNNDLARLQIEAMEGQQTRALTLDQDRTQNAYFQNALQAERSGVDTAPEILSMLKPEHRAQIQQFRLAQNQELSALNTQAADAANRMNSALRSRVATQEKAVADLQSRLATLPDSTFLGIGMNRAEGAAELARLQDSLATLREQAANSLFQSNRGLDRLATFDPAAGRFVPVLQPLRQVGAPPAPTPVAPGPVGMGNMRALEATAPPLELLSTDSPPAPGRMRLLSTDSPPAVPATLPLFLSTDSPPAASPTADSVPLSWLRNPRNADANIVPQANPWSPAGLAPTTPAAAPREVQVGEFFVTEDVAALALEEYNRVLQATGSPERAREASRLILSRRQNTQKAPAAQIMGGFPILSGMP